MANAGHCVWARIWYDAYNSKGVLMDYDQNGSPPVAPLPGQAGGGGVGTAPPIAAVASAPRPEPKKRGGGLRILWGILLFLSVLANIGLFVMLIAVFVVFAGSQGPGLNESIVREGPASVKIAVINVQGVIHGQMADSVYRQLKAASKDSRVKGLIVRVNSPGGTISGSDQIHNEILRFRKEQGKPVIAFQQSVAASGGYYASVACEKIIAEPTAITGSIGVISYWLVVQELLEDKLGVQAVTIKSGLKKDWPSSFRAPTEEEIAYMDERLIQPAYKRFLDVIVEGRKGVLTRDEIKELADGGIFVAEQAKEEDLIDDIGYLDDAISLVLKMANIGKARVIEYRRPFSFMDIMSYQSESLLKLDRSTLYELSSPQVLYLWTAY